MVTGKMAQYLPMLQGAVPGLNIDQGPTGLIQTATPAAGPTGKMAEYAKLFGIDTAAPKPAPPAPPALPTRQPTGGIFQNIGAGVKKGGVQTALAAGGLVDFVGDAIEAGGWKGGGQLLQTVGANFYEHSLKTLDELERLNPSGNIVDDPKLLRNPAWWAQSVAQAATSMGAALVLGGGTPLGGAIAGSIMEAAPSYQNMREEGRGFADAGVRAVLFGAAVAALEKIGLDKILKGKSASKLLGIVGSAVTEASTEWAEEPIEAFLRNIAKQGVTPTDLGAEVFDAMRQGINVIPASLIVGGVATSIRLAAQQPGQAGGEQDIQRLLQQSQGAPAGVAPTATGVQSPVAAATPQQQGPTPVAPTTTPEIEAEVAVLREQIGAEQGRTLPEDQFTVAAKPQGRPDADAAERAGQVLGKNIVWLDNNHPEQFRFHGTATDSTIFLSTESTNAFQATVLHEAMHQIRRSDPDLYQQLKQAVTEEGSGFEQYLAEINATRQKQNLGELSADMAWEELIAETVGQEGTNPQFWQDLYAKSPNLVQRLIDFIAGVLDSIRGVAGLDAKTTQYFADFQRIHDTAVSVVAEFSQRQQGRIDLGQGAPTATSQEKVSAVPTATTTKPVTEPPATTLPPRPDVPAAPTPPGGETPSPLAQQPKRAGEGASVIDDPVAYWEEQAAKYEAYAENAAQKGDAEAAQFWRKQAENDRERARRAAKRDADQPLRDDEGNLVLPIGASIYPTEPRRAPLEPPAVKEGSAPAQTTPTPSQPVQTPVQPTQAAVTPEEQASERITTAIRDLQPVSASDVDLLKAKLPDGYRKQGEQYVHVAPKKPTRKRGRPRTRSVNEGLAQWREQVRGQIIMPKRGDVQHGELGQDNKRGMRGIPVAFRGKTLTWDQALQLAESFGLDVGDNKPGDLLRLLSGRNVEAIQGQGEQLSLADEEDRQYAAQEEAELTQLAEKGLVPEDDEAWARHPELAKKYKGIGRSAEKPFVLEDGEDSVEAYRDGKGKWHFRLAGAETFTVLGKKQQSLIDALDEQFPKQVEDALPFSLPRDDQPELFEREIDTTLKVKRDKAGRVVRPAKGIKWPKGHANGGGWRVISLFDGIAAARQALKNLGIPVGEYHASEIEQSAINIAQANHDDIAAIGDVSKVKGNAYGKVDLLCGGSPCQNLSRGARVFKTNQGIEGQQSSLFWEYARVLKEAQKQNPDVKFLFENVNPQRSSQQDIDIISRQLGVQPIRINSATVSGQMRDRLYWTNIPNVMAPTARDVRFSEIAEKNVPQSYEHTTAGKAYMDRQVTGGRTHWDFQHHHDTSRAKSHVLPANLARGVPYNVVRDGKRVRKLTEHEMARLQGFPDSYFDTDQASYNQKAHGAGNSWTVPVIEHILGHLAPNLQQAPRFSLPRDIINEAKKMDEGGKRNVSKWMRRVADSENVETWLREFANSKAEHIVKSPQETREKAVAWIRQTGIAEAAQALVEGNAVGLVTHDERIAASMAIHEMARAYEATQRAAGQDTEDAKKAIRSMTLFISEEGRQMGRAINYFKEWENDLSIPGMPELQMLQALEGVNNAKLGTKKNIIGVTQEEFDRMVADYSKRITESEQSQARIQEALESKRKELEAERAAGDREARTIISIVEQGLRSKTSRQNYSTLIKEIEQDFADVDLDDLEAEFSSRAAPAKLSIVRRLSIAREGGELSDQDFARLVKAVAKKIVQVDSVSGRTVAWGDFRQQLTDQLTRMGGGVSEQAVYILQAAYKMVGARMDAQTQREATLKQRRKKGAGRAIPTELPEQAPVSDTDLMQWAQSQGLTEESGRAAIEQAKRQATEESDTLDAWAERNGLTGAQAASALAAMRDQAGRRDIRTALEQWAEANNISADAIADLFSDDTWQSIVVGEIAAQLAPQKITPSTPTADELIRRERQRIKRVGRIPDMLKQMETSIRRIVRQEYSQQERTRAELIRRLTEEAGITGRDAERLADAVDKEFSRLINTEAAGSINAAFMDANIQRRDLKDHKAVVELLNALRHGVLNDAKYHEAFAKAYGLKTVTPEMRDKLEELRQAVESAPEGWQRANAATDMLAYIDQQAGIRTTDKLWALWYANLLSGYQTHQRNMVSTFANTLAEIGSDIVAHPRNAPFAIMGMLKGVAMGVREARAKVLTGKGALKAGDKWTSQPDVLEKRAFKGPFRFLNSWKYVMRLMIAEDILFFKPAQEAKAMMLAADIARQRRREGTMTERSVMKEVGNILFNTSQKIGEFRKQAEQEGLKGNDKERRVFELMEQSRPEKIKSVSLSFAHRATFNYQPEGQLGILALQIKQASSRIPALRLVVPFTNIVANVANVSLDYTPLGVLRAQFGMKQSDGSRRMMDSDERAREMAKAFLGTAAFVAAYALNQDQEDEDEPMFRMHGPGPSDRRKQYQLRETGWKPYSIQFGKKYVSFLYTPMAIPFSMLSSMIDARRYDELSEDEIQWRIPLAAVKAMRAITDMSFLSGVSGVFDMMNREHPEDAAKAFTRQIARTGTTVIPNLAKQIHRYFDPRIQDASTLTQMFLREIPVARSGMRPKLNMLGEAARFDTGVFIGQERPDKVWKLIVEKKAWISEIKWMGDEGFYNQDPLTRTEHYNLVKRAGELTRQQIEAHYDELDAMEPDLAQKYIAAYRTAAKTTARGELWNERQKKQ